MDNIVPQDTPLKQCPDCKEWFPSTLDYFVRNSKNTLRLYCRPCTKARTQERERRNIEYRDKHVNDPKQCRKCTQFFPATSEYFYKFSSYRDGWDPFCKKCRGKGTTFGIKKPNCGEGEKHCSRCLQVFPATTAYFHRHKGKLSSHCKQCKGNSAYFGKERGMYDKATEKWCPSCERALPRTREYFNLANQEANKLQKWCIECKKNHHKKHKDRINLRVRAKRADNLDMFRQMDRMRYASNPVRKNEQTKRSYLKNRDKRSQSKNRYRINHLGEHNAYMRNRRALKKAIPGNHTARQVEEQYNRQHGRCYYCNTKLGKDTSDYHADHTFPITREYASNDISHIVVTCPTCNIKKGNKYPWEFPEGGRLL